MALAFIFLLGGNIILLSMFVEHIFALAHRLPILRSSRNFLYRRAEWQTNSTLQLQRLAHENLSLGTWSKTDKSIPVTEPGETLGVLDINDLKHTRIVRPGLGMRNFDSNARDIGVEKRFGYPRISTDE